MHGKIKYVEKTRKKIDFGQGELKRDVWGNSRACWNNNDNDDSNERMSTSKIKYKKKVRRRKKWTFRFEKWSTKKKKHIWTDIHICERQSASAPEKLNDFHLWTFCVSGCFFIGSFFICPPCDTNGTTHIHRSHWIDDYAVCQNVWSLYQFHFSWRWLRWIDSNELSLVVEYTCVCVQKCENFKLTETNSAKIGIK